MKGLSRMFMIEASADEGHTKWPDRERDRNTFYSFDGFIWGKIPPQRKGFLTHMSP